MNNHQFTCCLILVLSYPGNLRLSDRGHRNGFYLQNSISARWGENNIIRSTKTPDISLTYFSSILDCTASPLEHIIDIPITCIQNNEHRRHSMSDRKKVTL